MDIVSELGGLLSIAGLVLGYLAIPLLILFMKGVVDSIQRSYRFNQYQCELKQAAIDIPKIQDVLFEKLLKDSSLDEDQTKQHRNDLRLAQSFLANPDGSYSEMKKQVTVYRNLKLKYLDDQDSDDEPEKPSLFLLYKIRSTQDIHQISENVQERASYIGIVQTSDRLEENEIKMNILNKTLQSSEDQS